MKNLAHKTAIGRNKPSKPTRILFEKGLLKGSSLDFGCGKGYDADHFGFTKYDLYYYPIKPSKKYKTIICNFVINTREITEEEKILQEIKKYLNKKGTAYITVRRDIKKEGYTSKGTYQRNVVLSFPIIHEDNTCCIYELKQ